ncbi:hypothetical protein GCM10011402_29440 [Paracoccus acridae]|uniref:VPLPA-CTERM sorting domain-containing protein n=1 Tax=Paracoccus acridae TaxID=1795310 RepID=A0ABQ1VL73_9RHOB|nr:VPLPA-CTERM sorting domain-containing protein [Paracoccus acridae]GGF74862.1 hypothetical protein GCM10011402_29440 [Paracoccus acridae]
MLNKLVMAAVLMVGAGAASAATISTLADENGTINSWGMPDTTYYGQTVSFGDNVDLNSFEFRINSFNDISYNSFVYAWDDENGRVAGSALFSGTGTTLATGEMTSYLIDVGHLALTAGKYVIFLGATSAGSSEWGATNDEAYDDGTFVFINTGGGAFGSNSWTTGWNRDLAFAVNYDEVAIAPVPLPASGLLLLAAMGGVGGLSRRRKQRMAA